MTSPSSQYALQCYVFGGARNETLRDSYSRSRFEMTHRSWSSGCPCSSRVAEFSPQDRDHSLTSTTLPLNLKNLCLYSMVFRTVNYDRTKDRLSEFSAIKPCDSLQ